MNQLAMTITIPELMRRFSVPGVSIALVHDLQVGWTKTFGLADVAKPIGYSESSSRK